MSVIYPELEEWVLTAPGLRLNPDRSYGNQCVDAYDAYAEAIFNVPWPQSAGGVQGAKQILDAAPDAYWIRTDNDPNNPNQLPSRYDVVVFAGSASNQWGHVAIVLSADQNGMWVVQQDGFKPPLVYVNGGWYSDAPCEKVWLPYYQPSTGGVSGWLTPRIEKTVNYKAPAAPAPATLLGYQRTTVPDSKVGYRAAPRANADLISWLEPDHTYDFKGYVNTDSGVWFVGRYSGGYSKATGFLDEGTHDLENLTPVLAPQVPVPVTPPQPTPAPTTGPRMTDKPHLNGIDVSSHNRKADLSKLDSDFFIVKATEGGGNWTDPALAENVAEGRASGKLFGFYHFARPLVDTGNTAAEEARSFLEVIAPYLQEGDLLVLDWEAENQHRTDWAKEWLDIVAAKTGAIPAIYLNAKAINGGDWTAVEAKYPLWYAGGKYYNDQFDKWFPIAVEESQTTWAAGIIMWQYSSNGRLAGYDGALDVNVAYITAAEWKELGASKEDQVAPVTEPTPAPTPAPQPTPPVAVAATERELLERYALTQVDMYLKMRP